MSQTLPERIEALVEHGGDADDVLRASVAEIADEPDVGWAGIFFLEEGHLELGPEAGTQAPDRRTAIPIVWEGTTVGELAIDGDLAVEVLESIAARVAAHVLLGWDTRGEPWEP